MSGSGLTELASETERFVDGQVSLDGVHRRSRALLLGEDVTTLPVEGRVDTAEGVLGALNLDLVNGLLESGVGKKRRSVHDTTASRDKLRKRDSRSSASGLACHPESHAILTCPPPR